MKNNYILEIHFKDNIDFKIIDLNEVEKILENSIYFLEKEYIFYDKKNIDSYNSLKLNMYIRVNYEEEPREVKNKLEKLEYIKSINLFLEKSYLENNDINISINSIDNVLNKIDDIYFITKNLLNFSNCIEEKYKKEYLNNLQKLSNLKYELKRDVFQLRIIDIEKEINIIYKKVEDYRRLLGIDIKLEFSSNNIKLDKLLFDKIKKTLIDVLYSSVLFFSEISNNVKNKFKLKLNFYQLEDELIIEIIEMGRSLDINEIVENAKKINLINENKLSEKEILHLTLDKNYVNSFSSLDDKEKIINYIKLNNIVKEKRGSIDLENKESKYIKYIIKIPLDIIYYNALVFCENKKTYVINKELIIDIFDFDKTNLFELNSYKYYKYDEKNIIYISLPIEKSIDLKNRKALLVKVNNFYFVTDIEDTKIYYEDIYFYKSNESKIYMGECLLKSIRRARILDMENILKLLKG